MEIGERILEAIPKAVNAGVDAWRNWRCTRVLEANLQLMQAERDSLTKAQRAIVDHVAAKTALIAGLNEYVLGPVPTKWTTDIVPELGRLETSARALAVALRNVPGYLPTDTATATAYMSSMTAINMKITFIRQVEQLPAPMSKKELSTLLRLTGLLHEDLQALKGASTELGRHLAPGGLRPDGCPAKKE